MRATVGFRDMAALATRLAGIARIDEQDLHASQPRLVLDEHPKLSEAPIGMPCPLALANRDPAANVLQVFEHKYGLRAFGHANKTGRNVVVHQTLKTRLATGELTQAALG